MPWAFSIRHYLAFGVVWHLEDAPLFLAFGLLVLNVKRAFVDDVFPRLSLLNHIVYLSPVGQTPKVAVVYKHIRLELA